MIYNTPAGNYCERVIPDPIPNSEVKPLRRWYFVLRYEKSRTLPALKNYENQKLTKVHKKRDLNSS